METRGRKKGTPKTGGRKKGTPNKITQMGVDKVKRLVELMEEDERVAKELAQVHGKDFFTIYVSVLQYVRPKHFEGKVDVQNEVTGKMMEFLTGNTEKTEEDEE